MFPWQGGYSYVETANLDGETNLKIKMVPEALRWIRAAGDMNRISCSIQCDAPNGHLDQVPVRAECMYLPHI